MDLCQQRTEILNVLIGKITERATGLLLARLLASAPRLVNHYAVGAGGREECEAIAEHGHLAIVVKSDP